MENQDPERRFKLEKLDSRSKVQAKNLSLRSKSQKLKRDNQSSIGAPGNSADNSEINQNIPDSGNLASTSGLGYSNDIMSMENNDSLCDFRSPMRDCEMNESLADFRVKPTVLKSNKRLACRKSKSVASKKRRNQNIASNVNQPSIESSFFKPQTTVKTAFLCPLCFKSYKDSSAQHNHMKSCAAKNKVSTDKLLDAVQLQEKQANERKALGLLATPPIQPKKTIFKKSFSAKDPQLQLALALSMSLHEAQVAEEIEDAHLLAGELCVPLNAEMTEERRKTLQNFGFTTNKPVLASTSGKFKKKKPAGPTILQTRTQEERDRLLTVRIAEVLMGDEAITQALLKNVDIVKKPEKNFVLKSRLLQSYHCMRDRLWDKSQEYLSNRSSYSCKLIELSPCKVNSEPKIKQLEQGFPKIELAKQGVQSARDILDGNIEFAPENLENISENSMTDDKKVTHEVDEKSIIYLSKDWRCMLGAIHMSDVLITVKGGFEIHAHQIVFWARCHDILKDVTRPNTEEFWETKQRILWPETDALSAKAFLEYVYCGVIDRYVSIFDRLDMLAGVRVLARTYRLKKLFVYLRNKSNELKSQNVDILDQKLSKVEKNVESKTFHNNSSRLTEEESSNSSVETDINSVSTVCNDFESKKSVTDEGTSDNDSVGKRNSKALDAEGKENVHDLVMDCCNSSNDSFVNSIRISTTTSSTEIIRLKSSSREASQASERISMNIATLINNATDIQEPTRNIPLPSRVNYDTIQDHVTDVKLLDEAFEEERCTSPDIFDDSTTISSTYTYRMPEKYRLDPEHHTHCNDVDIKVVSTASKNLHIESPNLNEPGDTMVNMLQENNRRNSRETKVNCSFVSTRSRERRFKPLSADVSNSKLECRSFDQGERFCESYLKEKGDITRAIEKIQRLNAKTASESDSDCESVETFSIKKHRNPFCINITDNSDIIERIVKDDIHLQSDNGIPSKRRNKLSIFEKKIELEAARNPIMFNLNTRKPIPDVYSEEEGSIDTLLSKVKASCNEPQNDKFIQQRNIVEIEDRIEPSQKGSSKLNTTVGTIFDLTQESSRESTLDREAETYDTTTEDPADLSIFTKYKKKHSHNSIDKYRTALQNMSSQTSVTNIKDTDEASLSDDLPSSNAELWDISNELDCHNFSSKYELTDPDQSTSHVHRELSNRLSKGNERINSPPESLSSTESSNKAKSPVKLDYIELSDLEIDVSDYSSARHMDRLGDGRVDVKSQRGSTLNEKFGNRIFIDEDKKVDSFTSIKLDNGESTYVKNAGEAKKTDTSDQDTNTKCYIESILGLTQFKIVDKSTRQTNADEKKLSDIYTAETDNGEMKDKRNRHPCSEMKVDTMLDIVSKEIPKSQSPETDYGQISSPDCEISAIFSPPSIGLDCVGNITEKCQNFLYEYKDSSQTFRSSQRKPNDRIARTSTFYSPTLVSTPRIPKDDEVSDSEFDDIEFISTQDPFKTNCQNKISALKKSVEVEKAEKTVSVATHEQHYILDSDFSDSESSKIQKTKHSTSVSSSNKSKVVRQRSTQSTRERMISGKSSTSSLRAFKVKSVSENIIQTKSKSRADFMNDSFDNELARVRTPPNQEQNTSNNDDQTTPQQGASAGNVTPLANYSAMKTPDLRRELQKYGIKAQKRHRAKQILRYIYNELHPLVPMGGSSIASYSDGSSSDDERPPPKRLNKSNSFEVITGRKNTGNIELNWETRASDIRTSNDSSSDDKGSENNDLYTLSQTDNSEGLENVFRKLMEVDRSLHNKILAYEPIVLEELHATLKAQGLKCKLNTLMDFLDEQCITFRTLINTKKNRTRRKVSPKKIEVPSEIKRMVKSGN